MNYDSLTKGLYSFKEARNYIRWIYDTIKPYLGKRILEIGSGMGNYGKIFSNFELFCCTEIYEEYINILKKSFERNDKILVDRFNIVEDNPQKFLSLAIDTVVCIGVLEHIKEDTVALENIYKILVPGGRLIFFSPAIPFIYGANDSSIGHQRRYRKKELENKLRGANFYIEKMFYHNILGILGWFFNGKVLKRDVATLSQIKNFDKIVPLLRFLEERIPPFVGLNICAIARK